MAFITSGTTVISFADYTDVQEADQRLFEENEGLTDDVVEDMLIKGTERILFRLRASLWWQQMNLYLNTDIEWDALPEVNPNRIAARKDEFTDLCVYYALSEFILPRVADFGTEDNSEVRKINFYRDKYNQLFDELVSSGDFYDWDGDGTVELAEKRPTPPQLRKVR